MADIRTDSQTIILTEDNELQAALLQSKLSRQFPDYTFVHLHNGRELLDYLTEKSPVVDGQITSIPTVILLDIRMPVMNGLEALEAIRKIPAYDTLPVFMTTAASTRYDIDLALKLGANEYFVKPIDFAELIAAIKTCCEVEAEPETNA